MFAWAMATFCRTMSGQRCLRDSGNHSQRSATTAWALPRALKQFLFFEVDGIKIVPCNSLHSINLVMYWIGVAPPGPR